MATVLTPPEPLRFCVPALRHCSPLYDRAYEEQLFKVCEIQATETIHSYERIDADKKDVGLGQPRVLRCWWLPES